MPPRHSYAEYLYRYPQRAFPYDELVAQNADGPRRQGEFELSDTGVLAEDRFFDVVVTHAKAAPTDIVVTVTATNHGPSRRPCTSSRSSGSATPGRGGATTADRRSGCCTVPGRRAGARRGRGPARAARPVRPHGRGSPGLPELLMCDNESDAEALWGSPQPVAAPEGRRGPRDRPRRPLGALDRQHRHQGGLPLPVRRGGARRVGERAAAADGRPDRRPAVPDRRGGPHRPPRRRGRVLRRRHPGGRPGGGSGGRAARLRRAAVDPAALPLRRRGVAGRRPRLAAATERAAGPRAGRPEHLVAQPRPGRRHLDAGRVGVPVVRDVGPRVPRGRAVLTSTPRSRSPSCCCSAGVGPAPQRAAARLRVGVLRREPARARLGRVAGLPARRRLGPRLPHPHPHQAAAQRLVVGEPQGLRRLRPVRGRLPRHGQHRGLRPVRSRSPRAGGSSSPTPPRGWPSNACR